MSTDLAVRTGSSLSITAEQDHFSERQLAALRQLGVENAEPGDLAVFLHQCQRTGLDPFARQIYMVGRTQNVKDDSTGRWDKITKYTIQTGIDGFRLIGRRAADQRHETLEVTDTEWCGKDGRWRDVWLSSEPPAAARVAIIRNGGRFPGLALLTEYAQFTGKDNDRRLTKMWAEKPALMLAKCAEALAWRRAFPHDLSGMYTSDEMGASEDRTEPGQQKPKAEPLRTDDQSKKLFALLREREMTERADVLHYCSEITGRDVPSTKELTVLEASNVIEALAGGVVVGEPVTA